MTVDPKTLRFFGFRTALFSAAAFLPIGIYIPFFPLWLRDRGFSEPQIGAVFAAPLYARALLSPLLTVMVDRFGSLGRGALVYGTLATTAFALVGEVEGFLGTLVLCGTTMVFWNSLIPIGDAAIIHGVKHAGLDYSRTRLWGSVAFICANMITGVFAAQFGVDIIYPLLIGSFAFGAINALVLPYVPPIPKGAGLSDVTTFLRDRNLRLAFLAGAIGGSGHAAVYAYGTLYWEEIGFSKTIVGALWSVGVITEVLLFFFAKKLRGFGARRFLIFASVSGIVRWIAFPFAVHPLSAFALQCLHGLTFGAAHVGVMMAIASTSTMGHTARLQAGYQFLGGTFMASAMLVAGPLFAASPVAVFTVMAGLGATSLYFARKLPRGLQPKGEHPLAQQGGTTPPNEAP